MTQFPQYGGSGWYQLLHDGGIVIGRRRFTPRSAKARNRKRARLDSHLPMWFWEGAELEPEPIKPEPAPELAIRINHAVRERIRPERIPKPERWEQYEQFKRHVLDWKPMEHFL